MKKVDMNEIECFLFDLDGTIYLGGKLIDGAREAVESLRALGKKVLFLTNNSSVGQLDYCDKLNKMGLKVTPEDIYTAGNATIDWLSEFYSDKSVYLLGTDKLIRQFSESGIKLVNASKESLEASEKSSAVNATMENLSAEKNSAEKNSVENATTEKNSAEKAATAKLSTEKNSTENAVVDIVVVGFDTTLTYDKLCTAINYIRGGAMLIATHPDFNCPTASGYIPDVGSFLALIEASCGKRPDLICGKPHLPMGEAIAAKINLPPSKIAMVGDRLMTDMRFGIDNGFATILVLSGEATEESLEDSGLRVDLVLPSVAKLICG